MKQRLYPNGNILTIDIFQVCSGVSTCVQVCSRMPRCFCLYEPLFIKKLLERNLINFL